MIQSNETLLEEYRKLPDHLEKAIAGLDESDLDLHMNDEWSIREYVCHLVEGEQFWQINLRVIIGLNGERFPFDWYFKHSQIEWVEHWAYRKRSLKAMLDLFRADTQYLVNMLESMPAVWEHYGRVTWPGDEEETRLSVRDIIEICIYHMAEHAEDIRAIRVMHGC
jgi:hypothetical protein